MNCAGGISNMLSVRKVKLHGMSSAHWTTRDKITQYKGMINLYTRDRKIIDADEEVYRKGLKKEIKNLLRDVANNRLALDNAVGGDKQYVHNALAEDRELQLAYRNSPPEKVIECIHQNVFSKRRLLDKLVNQNICKSKKLVRLELERADLSERIKNKLYTKSQQQKQAETLAGKVQDATLRKEAAIAIKHVYNDIIAIMKKDAIYYDAVISTLQCDNISQSRCILNATRLGQLATENLDDRKQDYKILEKAVIHDARYRENDLKRMAEQVTKTAAVVKNLIRRDSEINTCSVKLPYTPSLILLEEDIKGIEKTLEFLKSTTLVPTYEQILPCLKEQARQRERLEKMYEHCQRDRDILLNKLNHAEVLNSVLKTSRLESTEEYEKREKEMVKEIDTLNAKIESNGKILRSKQNIKANLGIALRHLLQLSKFIRADHKKDKLHSVQYDINNDESIETPIKEPEREETDENVILSILNQKFGRLMSRYSKKSQDPELTESYKTFEAMMVDHLVKRPVQMMLKVSVTSVMKNSDFLEQSVTVPTREEIKKHSEQIVEANMTSEL